MATLDGLQTEFRRRVELLLAETGRAVWVNSAYRSTARQTQLYAAAIIKYGPRNASRYVARPGRSNHERGEAVDLGGDLALAARMADHHELHRPMSWEPWHFERTDLKSNPGAYTRPPPTMEEEEMAGKMCVMPKGATPTADGRWPFYAVNDKGEVFNHNIPPGYGIKGLPQRGIKPAFAIIGVAVHPNPHRDPAKELNIILFEDGGGTHDIGPNQ